MNKLNQHLLSMALVCISLMAIAITVGVATYEHPPATTTSSSEGYWVCTSDTMRRWLNPNFEEQQFTQKRWLDIKVFPPPLGSQDTDLRDWIIWCGKMPHPPEETKQEL